MSVKKLTTIIFASLIALVVLTYCVYKAVDRSNHYDINITICYGGEDREEFHLEAGSVLMLLETPNREGYEFKGWYSDSEFTQEYDIHSKIKKDTCIYAKFDPIN